MTLIIRTVDDLKQCPSSATDIALDLEMSESAKRLLKRLDKVKVLRFESNAAIANFDGLQSLRHITTVWAIGQHNLRDMSVLMGLPALRKLYITAAWQLDPGPIRQMPFLRKLMLDGPRKGMSALSGLRDIEHLELRDVRLTHLKGFKDLERLRFFEVRSSPLRSLEGFPLRSPVEHFDLTRTSIDSLEPVSGCSTLKVLWLDRCKKLKNINPIAKLVNLRQLRLDGLPGEVCLKPLAACPNLEDLHFYDTRIKPESRSVLFELKKLKTCEFTNFPEPNRIDVELLQRNLPGCKLRVV